MGELANLVPAGGLGAVGVGGLLVMVVAYLLNANRLDRREYQDAIDRAEKRANEAERRTDDADRKAEDKERQLDAERKARREAEDRAAVAERELAQYRPSPDLGRGRAR